MGSNAVRPYESSFCMHFIVAMQFLDVKASRPMTFQLLTVEMVQSIKEKKGRGHDRPESVRIRLADIRAIAPGSAAPVRSTRGPFFEYNNENLLLVTRHSKKLTKLSSILGKMVFSATGKYIHLRMATLRGQVSFSV